MGGRRISELSYVGIDVRDVPAWTTYAREVLGLRPGAESPPGGVRLRMDGQAARILLVEGQADDLAFIGWRVADAAALQDFAAHLDAQGCAWQWGRDDEQHLRGVERLIHFRDPSGNRHEVCCGPHAAASEARGSDEDLGFVTGDLGLGHLVLTTGDYSRMLDFVQRVLGLGLSDRIALDLGVGMHFELTYFHANARHHSIGIAPPPPGDETPKRLHHLMLEVSSLDRVGQARDRSLERGHTVVMDIGRHPNDDLVSYYGDSPARLLVQVGWGGTRIDPVGWEPRTYDRLSVWGHRPLGPAVPAETPVRTEPLPETRQPSAIAGRWQVKITTPLATDDVDFDLEAEGDQVRGWVRGPRGDNPVIEGHFDGTTLRFRSEVHAPLPMVVNIEARIDGERIAGHVVSPFGRFPFSGERTLPWF